MRRRRLAAHREEALARREPVDGMITVCPPPPAILRVGLVVVHHFPDATYTSVSASVTDAKGRADSGATLRGRYSTKYNFNWDLLKVLFV